MKNHNSNKHKPTHSIIKKTVYVEGMDCISCETVLHDALEAVPTIKVLSLTHKTGKMTFEYKSSADLEKLETILKEHNYTLREEWKTKSENNKRESIVNQFVIWSLVLVALYAFMQLDLTKYLGDYGPNMWFWVAFLVGLVACGSSCLAVTGGIVVSYMESLENKTRASIVKTQVLFHIGRLVAFIWWWALLGIIWKSFAISSGVNGFIMMLVGLILAYVGLQIFGIVPSISKRGFHLPSWIDRTIKKHQHPSYAPIVWFLTFFLPCGFTQSMQLFAMQSGSATQWAMILGAYALGTIPLLLWLWLSAGYFKEKLASFNKVVAGLLVVFGLITFSNGYTLFQWNSPIMGIRATTQSNIEKLSRKHLGNTLEPKNIAAKVGQDYQIIINPTRDGIGCKSSIRLPDGTFQNVRQNSPISFNFKADKAGTYTLSCPMWSPHGSIVVSE